jgi:hypothetical protein
LGLLPEELSGCWLVVQEFQYTLTSKFSHGHTFANKRMRFWNMGVCTPA